jgi:succinate dehydrogenase / fumarate reductase cytochrome b subunit
MARSAAQRPNPGVPYTHFRPGDIEVGTIAWILHRITGVFLVVYLLVHIFVIGQAVRGQDAFNAALHFVQTPVFVVLDCGLAGIVTYHGINGLRVVAFDMGRGIHQQKWLFWVSFLMAVGVFIACLIAARSLL